MILPLFHNRYYADYTNSLPQRYAMSTSRRKWNEFDPPGRAFIKMQGLRNHFVIVDGRDESYSPEASEIINICDQKTGVGADQLVII